MPQKTPVAVFAYNRPAHLRSTLRALAANPEASETEVFLFSDGPKTAEDEPLVSAVRAVAEEEFTFAALRLEARERNVGLAQNIMDGVSETADAYGSVIVLEDDLVTSPFFLAYMNRALDLYRDEPRVASVHGYVYPTRQPLPETFFIRGADCWGWATWKRAWQHYNPDGTQLLAELQRRGLEAAFDFDETFEYTRMLHRQTIGKNSSWAVRWYASAFLNDMLTLYPARSLVRNVGHDGTGTHSRQQRHFDVQLSDRPIQLTPIPIEESPIGYRAFKRFFRGLPKRNGLWGRWTRRFARAIARIAGTSDFS